MRLRLENVGVRYDVKAAYERYDNSIITIR